ncbi:MAG: cysteine synthase A, partial [Candidatus Saganbacteria bacterium]|nr:cysteine synthase A [Candidatus Saganbacteria bacterium]
VIYGKLESSNPFGSIKDRIALSMIEAAEKEGKLKKGAVIIEPTSGNTGIALAAIGNIKGYRVVLTMPETMSEERKKILRDLGAEVVLTKGGEGMDGAIKMAKELNLRYDNSIILDQFSNPANPEIHRRTTAEEIWKDTKGKVDIFVAGVGTGGTITGVGEALKSRKKDIKVIAVEPASSAVLSGEFPGSHRIQGIGAGFIPKVLNINIIDEIIKVKDEEAFETVKKLKEEEGVFVGISSGAAAFAALKVAKRVENKGKTIVTIFPDGGERYLSIGIG